MLTRSRAAAKAREQNGTVVVRPSATGLGKHTKWIYPDAAPAPPPLSPPPSPPKRNRPSTRAPPVRTPSEYSLFDGTLSSVPSRLGSPISLGPTPSIGGVLTPRSVTPSVEGHFNSNGSTYMTHAPTSFLRPTDNRSTRSSVTPAPLSARSTPCPEGRHMVNGVYVCDCLDVPSGPPPLRRYQCPVTPPQSNINQVSVSHLHAPRKSQGLRYVNYSFEEGEILDWRATDTFTTAATSEIMDAREQLEQPMEESLTEAQIDKIVAREMEALLAQRNRGLVEDTEMGEDMSTDTESERGSIDTPTAEAGFSFHGGGAFYIRGDTVEIEEPKSNGQHRYKTTEPILTRHESTIYWESGNGILS